MVLSMIASALRSCHLGCLRYGTKPLGVPAPAVERRIVHGSASISIFIVAVIVLSSCLHNDLDWLSSGRLRNPAFPHLGSHFKQEKVVLTIVHPSIHPLIDRWPMEQAQVGKLALKHVNITANHRLADPRVDCRGGCCHWMDSGTQSPPPRLVPSLQYPPLQYPRVAQ